MTTNRARIAGLASGRGTTFEAIATATSSDRIPGDVVLLLLSKGGLPAAERADRLGIATMVIDEKSIGADRADREMLAALQHRRVELIVLAGYLRKVGPLTLAAFEGAIVNTHPAPLPHFGGKGMYGDHVFEAVLAAGIATTAATVHLVDGEYDTGPVIAARPVPALAGDDVSTLRGRVQAVETELLVDTIRELATFRVSIPKARTF